jgi:hypothetical protein
MRRFALGLLTTLTAVLLVVPAGAASVKSRLLTVTNLPTGWSRTYQPQSGGGLSTSPCFSALKTPVKHGKKASVTFKNGQTTQLDELLATGKGEEARLHLLNRTLRACHGATLTAHGKTIHLSIGQMSFPKVARTSNAFSLTASVTGFKVGFDVVTFRTSRYVGAIFYGGLGSPNVTTAVAFAKEAVAKAEGKHVSPPSTSSTG